MEERIKKMYNAAAKLFNQYLKDHDIARFTNSAAALVQEYGNETDVCGLMIWWSARVQGLHDEYLGGKTSAGN